MLAAPAGIDAAAAAPAVSLDPAAAALVVLEAPGSNRDAGVAEKVAVTLAAGGLPTTLILTETAPASGVFAGAWPAAANRAGVAGCVPAIARDAAATLSFGGDEGSLPTSFAPLVDPAGLVFETAGGAMVDGAEVTLLTEEGAPAAVTGDDGISVYPATVTSGAAVTDAGGHRYPAMPGRYRFPHVAAGRYRLRVRAPGGYRAPSIAPPDVLAGLHDGAGTPFRIGEGGRGGVVTLLAAGSVAADVPVDRDGATSLLLTRTTSQREAEPGDRVEIRLHLVNRGTIPSGALHLVDTLPDGLRYRPGSMRGAAEPVADARSLDMALPSLMPGAAIDLRYLLAVTPGAAPGEAMPRAQARARALSSNVAAATVRIRPLRFTEALTLIGQVGEGGCAPAPKGVAGVRLLLEDGTVVVTDRDGLYHLEGISPGRHVVALDAASLPAGLEPVDCARDTASGGSATSRFVEGAGGLAVRADFRLRRTAGAAVAASGPALPIAPPSDAVAAGDRDWLAGRRPGTAWLFPEPDHNPRAPVTRVVIQHAPGERVALTIGGRPVDPLSFDATDDDGHGVAVSRWVGIPLAPGANRLAARVLGKDGRVVATLERVVTVSGDPAHAVLDPGHSRLVADGITPPLVGLRITDAAGRPVRAGTLVSFAVDSPQAAAIERPAGGGGLSVPVTGDDGLAFVPLRPTAQAGAATLHVALGSGEGARSQPIEAWLVAAARAWTVVGFGAGSLGFDTLSRHARALAPGTRDRRVADGQLALYAKGRIRGAWLLTLAYDSARRHDPDRPLLGRIDPDRYYTVYGDGAAQGSDAATARRLYLRLESRQAYLLFGDMETATGDAQLTRYARTITGLNAAYRGGRWRASGFAAQVDSRAGHDEIEGNGLSGPYRLRAQGIAPGSDTLRLEVRDRFRPERIVATTPLSRHLDYEIDEDAGTLRFAKPVASRDAALNPVFIVADYEVAGSGTRRLAAGARVERRLGRLALGAALIHDETRTAAAGVAGLDARLQLAPGTAVRAEVARGGDGGPARGGLAYAGEVEHRRGPLDLDVYARAQPLGFGLGQQTLVEAGTRKLGADLHWQAGAIGVAVTGWHQAMLGGPGERIAGQARVDWHRGPATLFAGAQVASDRGIDGGDRRSRLLMLGASEVLAGGALSLTAQMQFAPGGERASVDFPVRHQLTVAWRVSPAVRVIGGYEIDEGGSRGGGSNAGAAYRTRTAQLGVEVTPWHGAHLTTTLDQSARSDAGAAEAGRRFAQASIAQSLPLGAHWTLDATLDSATTLAGSVPSQVAGVAPFQPIAAAGALGQDAGDFRAATLGTAYRAGRWSGRARLEYRRGALDTRWSLSGDVLRQLGEGRTLAAGAHGYRVTGDNGAVAASTVADLALALRPAASRWSLLDRLTLRHDRGDPAASAGGGAILGTSATLASDQLTTRAADTVAIGYRSALDGRGHGIEATLSYGIKYVRGRYGDEDVAGLIDAVGFALRRGLGPHLDIGAAASVQHAWSDRRWAWSGGPSVGASPAGNLWLTLGYNIAGYRDRDLADDRYTRAGPYLTLRAKFDAGTIGAAARALKGVMR
jgi:uncharacterized repeat protein (TIGR01451 family)